MSDDWLWDGQGAPDPRDAALAEALGSLRKERALPPLPPRRPAWRWGLVAAVGALTAAAAALFIGAPNDPAEGAWALTVLEGASPCGAETCTFAAGESIVTGAGDRFRIALADVGSAELAPGSRLTFREAPDTLLLDLAEGTLSANVAAPPRLVQVETPHGRAVDLGCAFALDVTAERTRLVVSEGFVALENPLGTSIVGGANEGTVRSGERPRLPVRSDAPPSLRAALAALEVALGGPAGSPAPPTLGPALDALLLEARPADGLTLWHVLRLAPRDQRAKVVARVTALVPDVGRIDASALVALEPAALGALWQELIPDGVAPAREN